MVTKTGVRKKSPPEKAPCEGSGVGLGYGQT